MPSYSFVIFSPALYADEATAELPLPLLIIFIEQ